MNEPISPAFAAVLRACREEINARFTLMRREFPELETEPYFEFLRHCGDPVVTAVEKVFPVVETGQAVWEAGLELVARGFAGPRARHPWMDETWQTVLTAVPALVAEDPRRVIGSLSNAMHHLASTPDARPEGWIALMKKAAPLAGDVSSLLQAGQVAAWRSGLAHYREGALNVAKRLPAPLVHAALGVADGNPTTLLEKLSSDPWYHPDHSTEPGKIVARTGSFRGFGGPFIAPPKVVHAHGHWIATSGDDQWIVTADAFGATFHRLTGESVPPPSRPDRSALNGLTLPPDYGEATSLATDGSTLAVTTAFTHALLFFQTKG